jgi:hypothetical protein
MSKLWWIWIIVVSLIGLIFLVWGCVPDGQTGTRQATELRYLDNGTCTGYFAYYGFYEGDWGLLTQAGLNFKHHAPPPWWYDNDQVYQDTTYKVQHNECSYVTKSNGICYVKGARHQWNAEPQYYRLLSRTSLWHPCNVNMRGIFDYITVGAAHTQTCDTTGDRRMLLTDIKQIDAVAMLPDETAYLSAAITQNPPSKNAEKIVTTLAQQSGEMGIERVAALDSIVPNFATNTDIVFRHCCPMFYSVIIKTAEPCCFEGETFDIEIGTNNDSVTSEFYCYGSNADLQTHVFRSSPFFVADESTSLSTMNEIQVYDHWTPFNREPNLFDPEQYNITVKDNWKDFIDPNLISDPNIVTDPNILYDPMNPNYHTFTSRLDVDASDFDDILIPGRIITVPVISMNNTGDTLYYEFDEKQIRVLLKAIDEGWLQNNANYDSNQDGIVNFLDIY